MAYNRHYFDKQTPNYISPRITQVQKTDGWMFMSPHSRTVLFWLLPEPGPFCVRMACSLNALGVSPDTEIAFQSQLVH